jgi:hypothetical protein
MARDTLHHDFLILSFSIRHFHKSFIHSIALGASLFRNQVLAVALEAGVMSHVRHARRIISCQALGVQVRLVSGKADVVFLYNENVEGFSQFRGTLPEAISGDS